MHRSKTIAELSAVLALCAVSLACGSTKDESRPSAQNPNPNGGAGGNGNGNGNGGAGQADNGTLNVPTSGGDTGSGGSETITMDMACATGTATANLTPVDMFIQFDRSGSMGSPRRMPKWPQAVSALNAFFRDPTTAGLSVALHFFPDNRPVVGCTGGDNGACNVAACGEPLVPLAPLLETAAPIDAQETLLVDAVNAAATTPVGNDPDGTPLSAALAGALDWAGKHQAAVPDHKTVVILVTDGQPNGCESSPDPDTDLANTGKLAADALKATGVRTYTIGIQGSEQATMDAIAAAGGTEKGFFIGNAANTQTDLIAALNKIRGSVISCAFPLPAAKPGAPAVDPSKINVNFTPTGGAMQVVGKTENAAGCQNGGWYYDNPSMPAAITLCPATCMQVQADSQAKLDVLLGCSSQGVVPK